MPIQRKPEPAPVQTPELLDLFAIAQILSCSPRHVRRLSDAGYMPRPLHLGRCLRWRKADIACWIDDGCHRGPFNHG